MNDTSPTTESRAAAGGSEGWSAAPPLPGLTQAEATRRLLASGPNRLVAEKKRGGWRAVLWRSVTEPMSILLLVAAATYLTLGNGADAVAALVALAPIAGVSVVLERRAERALEELSALTAPVADVWRDGRRQTIPAEQLVVGDVVGMKEGDIVPADGRLVGDAALMVDESTLTGESFPVTKHEDGDVEVWAGTTVQTGRGVMEVTATGRTTRFGAIGALLVGTEAARTPLERSIGRLVIRFGLIALGFATLVGVIELARGRRWGDAVIAAVSLGMTAIPEEFPLVFTIYLALGARRLARHRALVRRLTAVETLGSTSVICTDKTGTLTQGTLIVTEVVPTEPDLMTRILEAAVLASEPEPFDPLDRAITRYAASNGVDVAGLHAGTLAFDHPFDPVTNTLTHVWERGGGVAVASKGALEGLLEVCGADPDARAWADAEMTRLGESGIRVIGVAGGNLTAMPADRSSAEHSTTFLGLIGFSDPTRPEVQGAIDDCHSARIRVVMITGDHPVTALTVAAGLGIAGSGPVVTGEDLDAGTDLGDLIARTSVFARIRPEQKHLIVAELRKRGEVVAMTGDGINDAPALREADIGVAMGERGTAVSREAATMVLLDDNFSTIVEAVREGRRIFNNLRHAFGYLVAFHVPLLLLALGMPLLGEPLLLVPFNLIVLEFLLHPIVALAFENDPPDPEAMNRPPRPREEGLLGRWLIPSTLRGVVLAASTAALYLLGPPGEGTTLALANLFIGELLLVFAERSGGGTHNRILLPLISAGFAVTAALFLLPPVQPLMGITSLAPEHWALAVASAAVSTLWIVPFRWWRHRRTGEMP